MKLDVIFVTNNHETVIKEYYEKVKKELKDTKYKIYFVDNCSSDDTLEIIEDIHKKDEDHTRIIKLSKHANQNSAILAGLNFSKNNYAVIYDLDLDFNANIKKMISFLENTDKYDSICLCKSVKEDNFFSKNYKKIINSINFYDYIDGLTNFRVFNRKMIDAIITYSIDNEINSYTFDNIGFNIYYDTVKTSSYNNKSIHISSYLQPIVLCMIIGVLCNLFSFAFIITSILLGKISFTTLTFFLLFFISGALFILTGIMGRNMLKHIYKKEPNFIIKEKIGFDENVL